MVDLYTALKLIREFDCDDRIVRLRKANQIFCGEFETLTVREIKNKYDMRQTKVTEICPYFCCGDYDGFLLTISRKEKKVRF